MIRKVFVIAISISAYLAFQRSWFFLASLAVVLFFGYEQYLRSRMIEYRDKIMPGKVKNQAIFLPYSEEEYNRDFRSILPSGKSRLNVFPQKATLQSNLISFKEGLRTTSFVPINPANKIYLFGGSTMLCAEVPDDYTISSQLQKIINSGSTAPAKRYEVINCGVGGASLKANYELFKQTEITKGDVCLFYFGVNEYDFSSVDFKLRSPFHRNDWLKNIENGLKKTQLQSINRLFLKFKVFRENSVQIEEIVTRDENLMNLINDRCQSNEVKFLAILQPHLFTRVPMTKIDKTHLWHYQNKADIMARQVLFEAFVNQFKNHNYFHDGRGIFNHTDVDVYIDWCHPNYMGNKIVADFFYSVIEQQLL